MSTAPQRFLCTSSVWLSKIEARTAAAVVVRGALRRNGKDVETSELTVDYVPAGSRRDIALFFTNDSREGDLGVQPLGYVEP